MNQKYMGLSWVALAGALVWDNALGDALPKWLKVQNALLL
jgi:hypothetical protein